MIKIQLTGVNFARDLRAGETKTGWKKYPPGWGINGLMGQAGD
jgi:hypothetical protein